MVEKEGTEPASSNIDDSTCSVCKELFTDRKQLIAHLNEHLIPSCKICKMKFNSTLEFFTHRQIYHINENSVITSNPSASSSSRTETSPLEEVDMITTD